MQSAKNLIGMPYKLYDSQLTIFGLLIAIEAATTVQNYGCINLDASHVSREKLVHHVLMSWERVKLTHTAQHKWKDQLKS